MISHARSIVVLRNGLGQIARQIRIKPVHAIDVVDSDGAEQLDSDGVAVDGELMS